MDLYSKGRKGELMVWDALRGERILTLQGYKDASFLPDGNLIATDEGSDENSILEARTGKILHKIKGKGIGRLLFSPNGKKAVSFVGDELVVLRLWQTF
jgi:WD40 repeat protein